MRLRMELTGYDGEYAQKGQGTLEYALVTAGFMALIAGLSALWRFASDGGFAQGLTASLTHRMPWGVFDVLLF